MVEPSPIAAQASAYQAKLFGGANMLRDLAGENIDIGRRNIARARELLAAHNIALLSEHVGGSGRRKLHFDLWSGDVWLAFPDGSDARIRKAGLPDMTTLQEK